MDEDSLPEQCQDCDLRCDDCIENPDQAPCVESMESDDFDVDSDLDSDLDYEEDAVDEDDDEEDLDDDD